MAPRRPRYFLIDLLLAIALCGLVAGLVRWFVQSARTLGRPPSFLFLAIGLLAWVVAWGFVRATRNGQECPECGRRFLPAQEVAGPTVCPQCHRRSLDPKQLRKAAAKDRRASILSLGILTLVLVPLVLVRLLMGFVADHFGRGSGIALSLVLLDATLGLVAAVYLTVVAVCLAGVIVALARARLSRSERYIVAHARKCAGQEGQETRFGPVRLWSFEPGDTAAMLREQMEVVRRRFEALVQEEVETRHPLRIFTFGRRRALVAFHRQTLSDLWDLDGLYTAGPARTISLSTEVVPYRLTEPEGTARVLFGNYFLETYKGFVPPFWLYQGIAGALAADDDDRARLNRRIIVAHASGTALAAAELFHVKPRALFRLLRDWYDHANFARLTQFSAQSWSVVDYLVGPDAPEERRTRFRAFLKELPPKEAGAAVFERHLGFGYDRLLDEWREWVLGRGVGEHEPPPPQVREALLGRLIPIAADPRAKVMDRIQAIRDLGRAGYVLGADVLIDLLRAEDPVPRREVVWALEAISGLALGEDVGRWEAWWAGLPRAATCGMGTQDREA